MKPVAAVSSGLPPAKPSAAPAPGWEVISRPERNYVCADGGEEDSSCMSHSEHKSFSIESGCKGKQGRWRYWLRSGTATFLLIDLGKHCRGLAFACVHSPARLGPPFSGYFSFPDEGSSAPYRAPAPSVEVGKTALRIRLPMRDEAAVPALLPRAMDVPRRAPIDTAKPDSL